MKAAGRVAKLGKACPRKLGNAITTHKCHPHSLR